MFDKETNLFQFFDPRCINLILTNKKELFKNSGVFEVGIFDHHNFIVKSLKSQPLNSKLKLDQNYSSFTSDILKEDFESNFKNEFITEYSNFLNVFWKFTMNMYLSKKDIKIQRQPFHDGIIKEGCNVQVKI